MVPKNNTCSILESGRIKIFTNRSLLARYLGVSEETCRRWSHTSETKYHQNIFIDFKPERFNNNKPCV